MKNNKINNLKIPFFSQNKINYFTFFIFGLSLIFISCKKVNKAVEGNEIKFVIYNADTLRAGKKNKINYDYTNTEFDTCQNRYLDIYYILNDSVFDGELMDLERFDFGLIEDVKLKGEIDIESPNLKKDVFITFFVYDEIQVPISEDSLNMKYVVTKFVSKTHLK